jgi:ABC-2 type transport system permease protein
MSSLTENQLISALSTLGLFLALFILDLASPFLRTGWQYWIGQAANQISLFRRYDVFTRGLFSLADLVFYVSVCAFFLFLTARMLEKKRWA